MNPRAFTKGRLSRAARLLLSAAVLLSMVVFATPAGAIGGTDGLQVTHLESGSINATDVAQSLVGPGVTISNVTYTGAPIALGTFTGGTQPLGFDAGIILSSGELSNTIGPNTEDSISRNNDLPGDQQLTDLITVPGQEPPLTYDAAILEFDFIPSEPTVYFTYVFGSDEYNEYVNVGYDDVFAFWVNGVNRAVVGEEAQRVSIDSINNGNPFGTTPNSHPELYRNNALGGETPPAYNTEMDGLTKQLTMVAQVNPNVKNHIRLGIADSGDAVYDSNVFVKAGSFTTNAPIKVTKAVDFNADGKYGAEEWGVKGDSASWQVTISNNGSLPATITASDTLHSYGAPFKLASNETTVVTYATPVTVDTTNTVTVTAVDAAGASFGPLTAKAAAKVLPPGVLEIAKTVDFDGDNVYSSSESAAKGSTAKWKVVVSNTGESPIKGIGVTDTSGFGFGGAFDLAAGTSKTFTYDTVNLQSTFSNTATATASGFDPVASTATATVIQPPPPGVLEISKKVDFDGDETYSTLETAPKGSTAKWQVKVTNSGGSTISGITVTDSSGYAFGPSFELGAGEAATFNYQTVNLQDTYANTATATASGFSPVASTATAVVTTPPPPGVLAISKAVDFNGDDVYSGSESAPKGSTAKWRVVVSNTGGSAITGISVTDSSGYAFGAAFDLAAGATKQFDYNSLDVQADISNTATATAAGFTPVASTATAIVITPPPPGVLAISKTVDFDGDGIYGALESAAQGSTAKWRVVVSNTGGSAITGISVTDSSGYAFGGAFDLAAGATQQFDYNTTNLQQTYANTATATASGFSPVASTATAMVILPPPPGVLAIAKTVDFNGDDTFAASESAAQGSTAKWRVVVSNTGGSTIAGISVTDSSGYAFGGAFDLAAGASKTFNYDTANLQQTYSNTATATAEGFTLVASTATAVVIVPPPAGDYGKITGGGYFLAKKGTMPDKPCWSNWIHFGFVAKRMSGESKVTGHATFVACNGWNFKARDFTSLQVQDGATATLLGTGELNKKDGYSFKFQIAEGKPKRWDDTLRLIIWETASGKVVFDSQLGAPQTDPPNTTICGGNLTIHKLPPMK